MYTKDINYFQNELEKIRFEKSLQKEIDKKNERISDAIKFFPSITEKPEKRQKAKDKLNILKKQEAMARFKKALATQQSANVILNSEDNITILARKVTGSTKVNDPALESALTFLNNSFFFSTILDSNKAINSNAMLYQHSSIPFSDFGGVNISSSLSRMDEMYAKVNNMINNKKGFLHVIDTETLGATNLTGTWQPSHVTEFARITTDLSNQNVTKTNILLHNSTVYQNE